MRTLMSNGHPDRLRKLDRDECFALLSGSVIGRVGYVVDGRATIVPVNLGVVDGDSVI